MGRAAVCLLFFISMLADRAWAIDPGTASGTLRVGTGQVQLAHAYAHLHDNAEQWLQTPRELRILVCDREVPRSRLAGLSAVTTLLEMARQDKIRGVLLRLDPAKKHSALFTVLYPGADPQQAPEGQAEGPGSMIPIEKLLLSNVRAGGSIAQHCAAAPGTGSPAVSCTAVFSAPLFHEQPVTAMVRGSSALESLQVKTLLARARALASGNLQRARQYSTRRWNRREGVLLAQGGAEGEKIMRQRGTETELKLKQGSLRLVVRGQAAAVIAGAPHAALYCLVLEDGSWKAD